MKTENTKDLFKPLSRGEMRTIAIVGMAMDPSESFKSNDGAVVSWVAERVTKVPEKETDETKPFIEVEMDTDTIRDRFRDHAYDYTTQLQEFLRGDRESAPDEFEDPETVKSSPKTRKPQSSETIIAKRPRGRPRKVSPEKIEKEKAKAVAELSPAGPDIGDGPAGLRGETDHAQAVAAGQDWGSSPSKKAKRKSKIKKVNLGTKASSSATDTVPEQQAYELLAKEALDNNVKIKESIINIEESSLKRMTMAVSLLEVVESELTTVKNQISAIRTEQTSINNLVSNALLYLLNSVVYPEGEEVSDLSQIPEPSSYLDLD